MSVFTSIGITTVIFLVIFIILMIGTFIKDRINLWRFYRENQKVNKWISISKGLPDNRQYDWVLVTIREKSTGFLFKPRIMEYRAGKNDWYDDQIGWFKEKFNGENAYDDVWEIVAWMPLPEPYAGK